MLAHFLTFGSLLVSTSALPIARRAANGTDLLVLRELHATPHRKTFLTLWQEFANVLEQLETNFYS
jgi:hypothetical protein